MKHDSSIGRVRPPLVEASKLLFGRQYRLEIGAVAGLIEPPIWSRRLSRLLEIPENQVAAELSVFAELGALQRQPLSEFDRRKTYERLSHPLWDFCRGELERALKVKYPDDAGELLQVYWTELVGELSSATSAKDGADL
jgi:hypothetical protein